MTKMLKGFRFDPELYARFKTVAQGSSLMVTEAFEKFMKACVEIGAVEFPQSQARKRETEAEAQVLLTWLHRGRVVYSRNKDDDYYSIPGRLLQLLPRIEDPALISKIEDELKKKG